jgi:hypothetical protein
LAVFISKDKPTEKPSTATLFRVKKFADFRDGFVKEDERKTLKVDPAGYEVVTADNGDEIYLLEKNGYAAVVDDKALAAQLVKGGPGLAARLDKQGRSELAKKLLATDVSVYVDMDAVNKAVGGQLRQGLQLMQLLMAQGGPGKVDKASMELLTAMLTGLVQAIEDSQAFLAGLDFRPDGLALGAEAYVKGDSKSDVLLKGGKSDTLAQLAELPAGQIGYSAVKVDADLLKTVLPLTLGLLTDPKSERGKAVTAAMEDILAAGPSNQVGSFSLPLAGLNISQYENPEKAVAALLKLHEVALADGTFQFSPLKGKPEIKKDAEELVGFKLHALRATWDLEKMAQTAQGGEEVGKLVVDLFKKIMGEELRLWIGTDGKQVVTLMAKDLPAAKKLLETYVNGKGKIGAGDAFPATRKALPAEASMLFMIDVPTYARNVIGLVVMPLAAQFGANIKLPDLDKITLKPALTGVAVAMQAKRARVDVFVPATTAREVRKLAEPIMKAFTGGGDDN